MNVEFTALKEPITTCFLVVAAPDERISDTTRSLDLFVENQPVTKKVATN